MKELDESEIGDLPVKGVYILKETKELTWTTGTSLPDTVADSQAIVTSSKVYLLGGLINGSYSSTVYTAPINSDGTLGTWTTGTSLPDSVAYSQAIVTSSRLYLLQRCLYCCIADCCILKNTTVLKNWKKI